jgi:hypothetical protein
VVRPEGDSVRPPPVKPLLTVVNVLMVASLVVFTVVARDQHVDPHAVAVVVVLVTAALAADAVTYFR